MKINNHEWYGYKKQEANSNQITINNAMKNNLGNYQIKGNSYQQKGKSGSGISVQATEAKPVALRNYTIKGDSTQFTTAGKQLLNLSEGSLTVNNVTVSFNKGKVTMSGHSTVESNVFYGIGLSRAVNYWDYAAINASHSIKLSPGTYTFSITHSNSTVAIRAIDLIVGDIGSSVQAGTAQGYRLYKDNLSLTFTLTEEKYAMPVYALYGYTDDDLVFDNIMLEKGSSATSYEPYTGGIASPNPDYPQAITSVGDLVTSGEHTGKYKIPVTVSGKNLFNYDSWFDNVYTGHVYYSITKTKKSDGVYEFVGTANTVSRVKSAKNISIKSNTNYNISFDYSIETEFEYSGLYSSIKINNNNDPDTSNFANCNIVSKGSGSFSYSFNSGNNTNLYMCAYVNYEKATSPVKLTISNIQLEESLTSTSYEPYHTPITTNIYLDEPLRGIGTAKDYIEFATGKRHNLINEITLNGTQSIPLVNWRASETSVGWVYAYSVFNNKTIPSGTVGEVLSNKLKARKFDDLFQKNVDDGISLYTNTDYGLAIRTNNMSLVNKTAINNYLSSNPIIVNYALATPTEEDINLPQINFWKGTNIITTNTELQGEMQIAYYIKDDSTETNLAIPSPTYKEDIQAVGDKTKNLCSLDSYVFSSTDPVWYFHKTLLQNFKKNTTYTLSFDIETSVLPYSYEVGYGYDNSMYEAIASSWRDETTNGHKSVTFTTNDTTYSDLLIRIPRYNEGTVFSASVSNIMLVEGSIEATYEPYNKYKIPVEITGKNRLNVSKGTVTDRGITLTSDGDVITINGTVARAYPSVKLTNGLQSAPSIEQLVNLYSGEVVEDLVNIGQYTVKASYISGTASYCTLFSYNGTTKELYKSILDYTSKTVISNNTSFIGLFLGDTGCTFNNYKIRIQLEQGAAATAYEPYHEPTITNIYLDKPLYKLGDKIDYINFATSKRHNLIGKDTYNGTESWQTYVDLGTNAQALYLKTGFVKNSDLYSNYFSKVTFGVDTSGLSIYPYGTSLVAIQIPKNILSSQDLSGIKQWLSAHNTEMIYELATPTEESIELPNLPLHKGTNIITVKSTLPSTYIYMETFIKQ